MRFNIFIIRFFHIVNFWEVSTILYFKKGSRIVFWKICPLRDNMKLDKTGVVNPTFSWYYVWILDLWTSKNTLSVQEMNFMHKNIDILPKILMFASETPWIKHFEIPHSPCWMCFCFHFQSTYKFVGRKSRTKEQLQTKMYFDEMETWLAEERLEETKVSFDKILWHFYYKYCSIVSTVLL